MWEGMGWWRSASLWKWGCGKHFSPCDYVYVVISWECILLLEFRSLKPSLRSIMIYISCFLDMQQPFFFHIKPTCALKSVRFMRLNCMYRSTYIYLLYFEVNACFFSLGFWSCGGHVRSYLHQVPRKIKCPHFSWRPHILLPNLWKWVGGWDKRNL